MAALLQHSVAGADLDCVAPKAYTVFRVLFGGGNYGYKIKYESEYLFTMKPEIAKHYNFKKAEIPQT